jgi:hypothetical protein
MRLPHSTVRAFAFRFLARPMNVSRTCLPHPPPTFLWRLLPCLLLMLLLPERAAAQAAARAVTVREAEVAIRNAQDRAQDLYNTVRGVFDGGRIPRDNCDETTGADCFKGDRECPVCVWHDDRRDMLGLGRHYDQVGQLVLAAPAGVRQDRLDWISAQRVGVWVRLGSLIRARRAVEQCVGSFWLCEALRAFVEHQEGNFETAEQRFRLLLRVMPRPLSCEWRDLSLLRDTTGGEGFGDVEYGGRLLERGECVSLEVADLFWTLADPLFTRPGNDRMTAHYARQVDLFIHEQLMNGMNRGLHLHSTSHHSDVLRHGWPVAYHYRRTQRGTIPSMADWRPRGLTHRGAEARIRLTPPSEDGGEASLYPYGGFQSLIYGTTGQSFVVLAPLEEALAGRPELFVPVMASTGRPRETYRPSFGLVESLPLQAGFFRDRGEPVLVARTAAPADAPPLSRGWQARSWDGDGFRDAHVEATGALVSVRLATPWEPQVLSIEALFHAGAYRARTGNRPPPIAGAAALSSVVLIEGGVEPAALADALDALLPAAVIETARAVSAYWELYTPEARNATVILTIRHVRRLSLGRILGIGGQPDRVVRWTEMMEPNADGAVPRSIALDLDGLPAGDYDVIVELVLDDGTRMATELRVARL